LSLFAGEGSEPQQWHSTLAALFAAGHNIAWHVHYAKTSFRRTEVPTYPFQRKAYWVPVGDSSRWRFSQAVAQPGERRGVRRLPLPDTNDRRYEMALSVARDSFIAEHRLGRQCVLAGSTVMAFLFEAFAQAHPGRPIRLQDLVLLKSLTPGERDDFTLHVRIAPRGERWEAKVFARIALQDAWQEIASAAAEVLEPSAEERVAHDIDAITQSWERTVSGERLYAGINEMGYHLGKSYQWLADGWYRDHEIVRPLRKQPGVESTATALHPGFLDSAMQCVESSGVSSTMDVKDGHIYVPFMTKSLTLYRAPEPGAPYWVHAQVRPTANAAATSREADVVVFDRAGSVVAKWDRIEYRQIDLGKLGTAERAPGSYYELRWEALPAHEVAPGRYGTVVVYTTAEADAVREQLKDVARDILVVRIRDQYQRHDSLNYDSGGLRDLPALSAAISADYPRVEAIFYDTRGTGQSEYEEAVLTNFYYPLHLARTSARPESTVKEFIFVTAHAQKIVAFDPVKAPFAAMQWALARTARNEYSNVRFRALDAPIETGLDVAGRLLRTEGAPLDAAWRDGVLYRPALAEVSLPHSPLRIDPEGTYLVTGGTRGIGLLACKWLKAHGAKRFILAARTIDAAVESAAREAIGDGEVDVRFVAVDLADPAAIRERLRPALDGAGEVKGIVHAAGQQVPQLISTFDVERARTEIGTKALGLFTIQALLDVTRLDFIVCTSSISALFGTPGAAAYGAANAFLDASMQALAPTSPGCRSVNLGAWSETGVFAAMSAGQKKQFEDGGVVGITNAQGEKILDDVFRAGLTNFVAANFDWPKLLAAMPPPAPHDWLSDFQHLRPSSVDASSASSGPSLEMWKKLPGSEREPWLTSFYRNLVAQTCQLEETMISPSDSLHRFGVDSVMALQIRQGVQTFCGLELTIPDILDNATIDGLVDKTMDFLIASDPTLFSRKKWRGLGDGERDEWLRAFYRDVVARVCQLDLEMISTSESMIRFGLDSVMALDLRERVQAFCGHELAIPDILDDATIDRLVAKTKNFLDASLLPSAS
jgi:NAD(P)-dependent dehydrogenase (short-subunit alcohol dehydrogenase family)